MDEVILASMAMCSSGNAGVSGGGNNLLPNSWNGWPRRCGLMFIRCCWCTNN